MTYPPQQPQQQGQQPPQPQYQGYPQQQYPQAAPQNSTLALVGFIMALASIILTFVPGISLIVLLSCPAALIISIIANGQIKSANGSIGGKGFAVAGIWISAVWMVIGLIIMILGVVFAASILNGLGGFRP